MRLKTAAALASAAGFLGSWAAAAAEGLAYSPWGNPGALTAAVRLFFAGLLFLVLPVAVTAVAAVRRFRRAAAASGLSPFQMALGEAVVLTAVDYEWHKHNQREAARLTESVMGPERKGTWPGE